MADSTEEAAKSGLSARGEVLPRRRGRGRPFKKGQSGNPGGKKRVPEEYKAAMTRLDDKAIRGLELILDEPRHQKFAEVCIYVVNRNHGKPIETHELSGVGGGPIRTAGTIDGLDSEQRAKRLAELEAKLAAKVAAAQGAPKQDGGPAEAK